MLRPPDLPTKRAQPTPDTPWFGTGGAADCPLTPSANHAAAGDLARARPFRAAAGDLGRRWQSVSNAGEISPARRPLCQRRRARGWYPAQVSHSADNLRRSPIGPASAGCRRGTARRPRRRWRFVPPLRSGPPLRFVPSLRSAPPPAIRAAAGDLAPARPFRTAAGNMGRRWQSVSNAGEISPARRLLCQRRRARAVIQRKILTPRAICAVGDWAGVG